jgi:hypothetical protein
MATAARVTASFLLALFASVGPLVVAVLLPWLKETAAFYITFVLMLFLPVMVASGLAWLPVMLAARSRGFDGKLGAVTMSPLAAAAFYALYFAHQGLGHDLAKPIAWFAMIFFAPMMIVFTSVFFYVERRLGQSDVGPASARVIMAASALLIAWVLLALILFDRWRS